MACQFCSWFYFLTVIDCLQFNRLILYEARFLNKGFKKFHTICILYLSSMQAWPKMAKRLQNIIELCILLILIKNLTQYVDYECGLFFLSTEMSRIQNIQTILWHIMMTVVFTSIYDIFSAICAFKYAADACDLCLCLTRFILALEG